ncbi:MAG: hypothetical protein ACYC97_08915 [Metallibacterium sp.]
MFNLTDKSEEDKRRDWYSPIGEYVLLFSDLEFELLNWIDLLSDNRLLRRITKTFQFSRMHDVLLELIDEYEAPLGTKEKWKREWLKARVMSSTRNLICHNPPIDNFRLAINDDGKVSLISRAVEVHILKKPIGESGSGLSLKKLTKDIEKLRELLIRLDSMHTEEIVRGD